MGLLFNFLEYSLVSKILKSVVYFPAYSFTLLSFRWQGDMPNTVSRPLAVGVSREQFNEPDLFKFYHFLLFTEFKELPWIVIFYFYSLPAATTLASYDNPKMNCYKNVK